MDSYDVRVGENLGDIVLVKIEKKKYWLHDDWYCKYIAVKTPFGDYVEFPCFRWLVGDNEVVLRDGKGGAITCQPAGFIFLKKDSISIPHFCLVSIAARLPQVDKISLVRQHRQRELEQRRKTYRQVHFVAAGFWTCSLMTDRCCPSL